MVIDPIQSVKGRVFMDCFRSIHTNNLMMNTEPRISTGNEYWTKTKPDRMARLRGLNKIYYNMNIVSDVVDECEVHMLKCLKAESWINRLQLVDDEESQGDFEKDHANTVKSLKKLSELSKVYKQ